MSSLLRDLTDMGIAVNPDVNTSESVSAQAKSKVVSIFESHWDKENRTVMNYCSYHLICHFQRRSFVTGLF